MPNETLPLEVTRMVAAALSPAAPATVTVSETAQRVRTSD